METTPFYCTRATYRDDHAPRAIRRNGRGCFVGHSTGRGVDGIGYQEKEEIMFHNRIGTMVLFQRLQHPPNAFPFRNGNVCYLPRALSGPF